MNISPPEAVAAGAQWRLHGETLWRESGVAQTNIPPGIYLIEFKAIPGWSAPDRDHPVTLASESWVSVSVNYAPQPRFPLALTATAGGFLDARDWSAIGFNAINGPGPSSASFRWESAARSPRAALMPTNNADWRVQVRALAFPGFRFIGWAGDVSGTRNPVTLLMNRPRRLEARFGAVLEQVAAAHSAEDYHAPGSLVVHGQFNYPSAEQLRELRWRPILPEGWLPTDVAGLGGPVILGEEIVFAGPLGHNPIHFNLTLAVPANDTGPRALAGQVQYAFQGGTGSATRPVRSLYGLADLVVNARPSPAARLVTRRLGGPPVIEIHGEVGRTYTVQQVPEFLTGFDRFWWFLADVTLTNSPQTWVDDTFDTRLPSGMYRAVLIE